MCQSQLIYRRKLPEPPLPTRGETLFIVYHLLLSSQLAGCRLRTVVILQQGFLDCREDDPGPGPGGVVTSSDEAWSTSMRRAIKVRDPLVRMRNSSSSTRSSGEERVLSRAGVYVIC